MAEQADFKFYDKKYEIRDKIRLEPIFNKSESKLNSKQEFVNLLNKKHKIDRSLQIGLGEAIKRSNQDKFSDSMKLNILTHLKKKNF